MQTLVFNTSTKTVKLYSGKAENSEILYEFENIPTVKVMVAHYEVMQKNDEFDNAKPILRLPISNTNMIITK